MENKPRKSRLLKGVLFLASIFALSSCGLKDDGFVPEPQVYSFKLQYNNENINGKLSVDISTRTINLVAVISKDDNADGTVTFSSSKPEVAEISSDGVVTLKTTGDTVITATVGDKTQYIVLTVINENAQPNLHSIIVEGGVAKDLAGNVVNQARTGDYLIIQPNEIAHKDFVDWTFSRNDIWQNGNEIKMPDNDVYITANFEDTMYTLKLVGATVTKAGKYKNPAPIEELAGKTSLEDTNVYQFAYDTEISIQAVPEIKNKMFVGFDYNVDDNRVGEEAVNTYSFKMEDQDTTYKAVFSDLNPNVLTVCAGRSPSMSSSIANISSEMISDTLDSDLCGFTGYKLSIKGNAKAMTGYPENIYNTGLDTLSDFTPKTLKIVMKNQHATKDITCELYLSYLGNMTSTGVVTIPANSVVSKTMHADICIGIGCAWGFALRKDIGLTESDVIPFKFVAGAAKTYPNGYPLMKASEDAQYLNFGNAGIDTDAGLNKSSGWDSNKRTRIYDKIGGIYWSIYAEGFQTDKEYARTLVRNFPAYDAENPTTSVYCKIINLVSNHIKPVNKFSLYFINGTGNPYEEGAKIVGKKEITIKDVNEVILEKIEVTRSASEGDMYFALAKDEIEGSGKYAYNSLMQFAFTNSFGY